MKHCDFSPGRPRKARTIGPRLRLAKLSALVVAVTAAATFAMSSRAPAQELSATDRAVYASAFALAETGAWGAARTAAAQAGDPLLGKVLLWRDLQRADGTASFAEIARFIEANPDWPGLTSCASRRSGRCRRRCRRPTSRPGSTATRRKTFDAVMRYVSALDARGRRDDADRLARERWPGIRLDRKPAAALPRPVRPGAAPAPTIGTAWTA